MSQSERSQQDLLTEIDKLKSCIEQWETSQRASSHHATRIVEILPEIVWETDLKGRLTYVNSAGLTKFGFSSEDLSSGISLLDVIVPSEHERAYQIIANRLQGEAESLTEYTGLRKDGSTFPMLIRSLSIIENGESVGLLGIAIDVSKLKEAEKALQDSEENYRRLVEVCPDGIVIHTDGLIRFANTACLEIFGAPDLETVKGRPVFDFLDPAYHEKARDRIIGALVSGSDLPLVEERFLKIDGTPFWAESMGCSIEFDGVQSLLLILRDVSARKTLEAKLRQTEKLEALGTLAGGVAHDFNNILHALLGYCDVALAQPDVAQNSIVKSSLDEIQSGCLRASGIVQQILSFSRASEVKMERISIQNVVSEALEFLRGSLPASIEIRANIEPDTLYINADHTQIYQVLLNLCTNASQAMGDDHGLLTVSLSALRVDADSDLLPDESKDRDAVCLSIQDSGCGMDDSTITRAFEPFFTTKNVGEGTGLGLSTVHGILGSIGGSIHIASTLGEGTTVQVYIPLSEKGKAPSPTISQTPRFVSPEILQILFLDDELMIVEMSTIALEDHGFKVHAFTEAEAALTAFRQSPDKFDIVICDMTMPKITGLDFASRIVELNPDMPILLCTGNIELSGIEEAVGVTIRETLQKPIPMKRLVESVLRHAARPHQT